MTFYETISKYYDILFPFRKSRLEFILSNLSGKGKILEIGCATGDLAMALSAKGYQMTAIDLDRHMIDIAKNNAADRHEEMMFKKENMLNIERAFAPGAFNWVLCFGNTLAHLQNMDEIKNLFRQVHRVLKKEGAFIVQTVNYDRILKNNIRSLPDLKREGLVFKRNYNRRSGAATIEFTGTLIVEQENIKAVNIETLYPLTSAEVKSALDETGFKSLKLFGDEHKNRFSAESPALIAIIKK